MRADVDTVTLPYACPKAVAMTIPWAATCSDNERNKARGGRAHSERYKAAREAVAMVALNAVRGERPAIPEGPVEVTLRFYPPTWRQDCHDLFKVLFDGLQGTVYSNDKQLRSLSHLVVEKDVENPRVEVTIKPWLGT